jgi:hypothetical protein
VGPAAIYTYETYLPTLLQLPRQQKSCTETKLFLEKFVSTYVCSALNVTLEVCKIQGLQITLLLMPKYRKERGGYSLNGARSFRPPINTRSLVIVRAKVSGGV